MDRLSNGVVKLLRRPAPTSKRTTRLKPGDDGGSVTVVVGLAGGGSYDRRSISHVISTAPLWVVQIIDFRVLNLNFR